MSNIYSTFETDDSLVAEGVWLEIEGPDGEVACAFRCLPAHGELNTKFSRAMADAGPDLRAAVDDGEAKAIIARVYADSVIVGWRDVNGRDGEVIAFTKESCAAVLTDLPMLLNALQRASSNWAQFRTAHAEQTAKN